MYRQKPKRKYIKKIKHQIGRDLVLDTVGTNQLVNYNNLVNLLQTNVIVDDTKIKRYKENLGEQLNNQQYNNDPNYQYQLKKSSKQLYNDIKESIFKGDEYKPPSTPKKRQSKRQSKFKYDDTPLTPFELNLKAQTEENIKRKTPKKEGPTIRQQVDKFLSDKSEPDSKGNYKILTPKLINEWKQRFIYLKGFKEDQDLVDNFSTIVRSYFDEPDQKQKDKIKRDVYISKDKQYKQDRENKKIYDAFLFS
jgi:hypothetical protein